VSCGVSAAIVVVVIHGVVTFTSVVCGVAAAVKSWIP
jgi:hypothetical protein